MKRFIQFSVLLAILSLFYACSKDDGQNFDDVSGSETSIDGVPTGDGNGQPQAGTMTAGEWNDLENWNFWLNLLQNNQNFGQSLNNWGLNTYSRYAFQVLDNEDQPVSGALVKLISESNETIWQNSTDVAGNAELFQNVFGNRFDVASAMVSYQGEDYQINTFSSNPQDRNIVNIPIEVDAVEVLDLVFIVDATGSMGDELEFLKTELQDVISRVQQAQSNLTIKLGATFYRDEDDQYLVRNFPLTTDIQSIITAVNNQSAAGGGDYEEAIDKALEAAIIQQSWSSQSSAKIAFLILDAPPHSDYQVIELLHQSIKIAAENGVKIIPVTASGINIETELLMRAFAILTNGTYCFVTDDSGIGNDHLEPTVGEYEIELLNDLMVRLINKYSNSNFTK